MGYICAGGPVVMTAISISTWFMLVWSFLLLDNQLEVDYACSCATGRFSFSLWQVMHETLWNESCMLTINSGPWDHLTDIKRVNGPCRHWIRFSFFLVLIKALLPHLWRSILFIPTWNTCVTDDTSSDVATLTNKMWVVVLRFSTFSISHILIDCFC